MRFVRYSILSSIVLASFAAGAFAQTFDVQNPFPGTQPLYGVSSVGSTLFAVGDRATFLRSVDGATNWTRILTSTIGATDKLSGVYCYDANTAVVIGTSTGGQPRVYRTTNGGTSVTANGGDLGANLTLNGIGYGGGSNLWVVGRSSANAGKIYMSANSGVNWSPTTNGINLVSSNYTFNSVAFYDGNTGLTVGTDNNIATPTGIVYSTSNSGTSWVIRPSVNLTGMDLRTVAYLTATTAFVGGRDATNNNTFIGMTTDGGLSWSRVNVNGSLSVPADVTRGVINDIRFVPGSSTKGWAVGDSTDGSGNKFQIILVTTDGGTSWQRQDGYTSAGTLAACRAATNLTAWAVGTTGNQTSLVTSYIGAWFQQSRSLGMGSINAMSFISRTVGFAVGTPNGTALPVLGKTITSGNSWTTSSFNGAGLIAGSSVTGVNFFNNNTGWVAGSNNGRGFISRTQDNGTTWAVPATMNFAGGGLTFPATTRFNAMRWQDIVIGYVVGSTTAATPAPRVYSTTDAGVNWTSFAIAGNGSLQAVATRPGFAFCGGYTQVGAVLTPSVYRSTDFGGTWTATTTNFVTASNGQVKGLYLQSFDSLWACGADANGGFIRYCRNASAANPTWNTPTTDVAFAFSAASVNSVYFVTPQIGFAVGSRFDGTAFVATSIDGGVTWTQMDPKYPVALNSTFVSFTNQADLWMGGDKESMLHTILTVPLQTSYPANVFLSTNRTTSDTARGVFVIGNTGTAPLTITLTPIWSNLANGDNTIPGDYILDPRLNPSNGSITIQPGVQDSFKVTFRPTKVGIRTGTLQYPTNSARGDMVTVRFNGNGAFSSSFYTFGAYGSFATNSMHNDTANVGSSIDDSLFITNSSGTARLNVWSAMIAGVNASDYSITKGITSPILPGMQDTIIVTFAPTSGYHRLARLELRTDAPVGSNPIFYLNGFGGCVEDAFDMHYPDTLFLTAQVVVGTTNNSRIDTVVVCNTCALPVTVQSQIIAGTNAADYQIIDSLKQGPMMIMPGECDTAVIRFMPFTGDSMMKSAQYVITTDALVTNTLTKELTGAACSQIETTDPVAFGVALEFDSVTISTQQHVSVITNSGVCDVMIDSVHLYQDSLNLFSVNHIPPHQKVLGPGQSDTVDVTFHAAALADTGIHLAYAVVYSNATNRPMDTIWYSDTINHTPSAVREPGFVVTSYQLLQNYPNPFNPSTMIRYDIATRGHVTLTVSNAVGQVVAVLVDEIATVGRYHVTFDASSLPSGAYTYQLKAGDRTYSKSMTLLK